MWVIPGSTNNPDTFFEWKRIGVSASQVTVRWNVSANTPKGQYRIRYYGNAKKNAKTITPFEGQTRVFQVV